MRQRMDFLGSPWTMAMPVSYIIQHYISLCTPAPPVKQNQKSTILRRFLAFLAMILDSKSHGCFNGTWTGVGTSTVCFEAARYLNVCKLGRAMSS
jgi:hypothetical protein